jgi:hypothetical protein
VSVTHLADNAVSLALELSTAMDKINKALTSLLEKVNSLKISIKLSVSRKLKCVGMWHSPNTLIFWFYALVRSPNF